jgi:nucleoside-diphosphate-sugar epimerase
VRRALVTGGTGFLGMHLATALAEAGFDEVRLLDVVRPEAQLPDPLAFLHGDVRDPDAVTRATRSCEVVVDNAALVPVTRATPAEFDSVNLEGCRVALDAARAEDAYVVHVSSSSIYGKPPGMPVTEDTPLAPFEPYGASKAKAEVLVEQERARGLVVSSLRSRALLGRGRLGLFDLIFNRIEKGKIVPLFGSGRNVLQMCDARDFASAAVACIEQRANADYNIAAGEFSTVREDLRALIDRLGSSSRLLPIPVWAIRAVLQPLALVGRSPFTAWHWHSSHATFYTSIEKAERELGWRPRHSNVDALEHAYHEYVAGTGRGGSAHTTPLPGALARLLRG